MKATLQDVANSGELGSGMDELEGKIEALRATDAAKADELAAGYKQLMSSASPDAAKKKAAEMLGKLQ